MLQYHREPILPRHRRAFRFQVFQPLERLARSLAAAQPGLIYEMRTNDFWLAQNDGILLPITEEAHTGCL
jgi:hypothetical protein